MSRFGFRTLINPYNPTGRERYFVGKVLKKLSPSWLLCTYYDRIVKVYIFDGTYNKFKKYGVPIAIKYIPELKRYVGTPYIFNSSMDYYKY